MKTEQNLINGAMLIEALKKGKQMQKEKEESVAKIKWCVAIIFIAMLLLMTYKV